MGTKRKTKADPPTVFPTLDEWERMPQQSKDAYLSQLKHPDWLSESELGKLAPSDRDAYYKSSRECELTQFLLYLAEQQSRTRKGMEANIRAAERICREINQKLFAIPPTATGHQLAELISLRETWIKACEAQKRADMESYYESKSSSLSPQQADQLAAAAANAAIAAARTLKELNAKSKGGKKGAAVAKAERGEDKERKAMLDDAKRLLEEWDRCYPDRHKPPRDEQHSDTAAFRIVANRHKGADGKPIMSAATIGRTLRREKAKGEKRGKYNRTGKKRGKYKPRT